MTLKALYQLFLTLHDFGEVIFRYYKNLVNLEKFVRKEWRLEVIEKLDFSNTNYWYVNGILMKFYKKSYRLSKEIYIDTSFDLINTILWMPYIDLQEQEIRNAGKIINHFSALA